MKRQPIIAPEESCSAAFQVINVDLAKGTFEGMASVFGSRIDAYIPTVVEPGAFTKTLQENAQRVKVLWQHDRWSPIGKPLVLQERATGLYVQGKISDTTQGRDALTLLRDGVVDELSMGFDPIRWEIVDDPENAGDELRHLKEVRLWEVSLVTFAADPAARIYAVHSAPKLEGYTWNPTEALRRVEVWAGKAKHPIAWRHRAASLFLPPLRPGGEPFLVGDIVADEPAIIPDAVLEASERIRKDLGLAPAPKEKRDDEVKVLPSEVKPGALVARSVDDDEEDAPQCVAACVETIADVLAGVKLDDATRALLEKATAALIPIIAGATASADEPLSAPPVQNGQAGRWALPAVRIAKLLEMEHAAREAGIPVTT